MIHKDKLIEGATDNNLTCKSSEKPLFVQLAEWLSDSIISGALKEGEKIPSTNEMSMQLNINSATALKAVNILVDKGIIYKKRGLGMFVSVGAVDTLKRERKSKFYDAYIKKMLNEATKLGFKRQDIIELIESSTLTDAFEDSAKEVIKRSGS